MGWSGQKINRAKLSIHFGRNFNGAAALNICNLLQLKRMSGKAKHLALPLIFPHSKHMALKDLKDRLFDKLAGWRAKLLSQVGRGMLIRSVTTPLLAYFLSFFALPKSWCLEIDRRLKKFWWGHKLDKVHNLSLKSWSSMCLPKSEGGLGFQAVYDMNQALLSKLAWKVVTNEQSLWVRILKGKYLQQGSFWETVWNPQASWVWKGILKMRPHLERGLCWLVGNGVNISIWRDPWIPFIPGFKPSYNSEALATMEVDKVANLINQESGQWNRSLLWRLFSPEHVEAILKIHLGSDSRADQ